MTDLANTIKNLKSQLINLEIKFDEDEECVKKREDVNQRLEYKLEDLIQINNKSNNLYINAGGKIFRTTRECVKNCIYPNILQDKMAPEGVEKGFTQEDAVYINIPGPYFKILLNVVRRLNTLELKDSGSFVSQLLEKESCKFSIELKDSFVSKFNLNIFLMKFFLDDERVLKDIRVVDKKKMNSIFKGVRDEEHRKDGKKKKSKR